MIRRSTTDHRADWQCRAVLTVAERDITGATAVVRYLCRDGLRWYRQDSLPRAWSRTFEAIGDGFGILHSEDELEGSLPAQGETGGIVDRRGHGRYILLAPPGGRAVVCLLGYWWDLSGKPMEMSLFLHLFGQAQTPSVSTWHRGYRLELGHGRGLHRYTHVQPVRAIGWAQSVAVPFAEQSVPDNFPTFPLRGDELTTLCSALAISLHAASLSKILQVLNGTRMEDKVRALVA